MNRNIVTAADADNLRVATSPAQVPPTFQKSPPGGSIAAIDGPLPSDPAARSDANAEQSDDAPPRPDDYLTKLLKYVPPEIIAAYVGIVGIVAGNVTEKHALQTWLAVTLVIMLFVTALYAWRVLLIVRIGQIFITVTGLLVYAFAFGGWFATMTWYQPWQGTIALILFGFLVAVVRLTPLKAAPQAAHQEIRDV